MTGSIDSGDLHGQRKELSDQSRQTDHAASQVPTGGIQFKSPTILQSMNDELGERGLRRSADHKDMSPKAQIKGDGNEPSLQIASAISPTISVSSVAATIELKNRLQDLEDMAEMYCRFDAKCPDISNWTYLSPPYIMEVRRAIQATADAAYDVADLRGEGHGTRDPGMLEDTCSKVKDIVHGYHAQKQGWPIKRNETAEESRQAFEKFYREVRRTTKGVAAVGVKDIEEMQMTIFERVRRGVERKWSHGSLRERSDEEAAGDEAQELEVEQKES